MCGAGDARLYAVYNSRRTSSQRVCIPCIHRFAQTYPGFGNHKAFFEGDYLSLEWEEEVVLVLCSTLIVVCFLFL